MVACSQRKVIYLVLLGCLAGFLVVHFEGAGFTTMKVSIHDEVGKLRARVKSLSSALEQEIVARKGGTQGVAAAAAAARIPSGSPADTEAALTRAYPLSRSRSTPEQTKGRTSSSSSPSSPSEITAAASSPFGDTPRSTAKLLAGLEGAVRAASERHDAHAATEKVLREVEKGKRVAALRSITKALRSRDQAAQEAEKSAHEKQTMIMAALEARLESKFANMSHQAMVLARKSLGEHMPSAQAGASSSYQEVEGGSVSPFRGHLTTCLGNGGIESGSGRAIKSLESQTPSSSSSSSSPPACASADKHGCECDWAKNGTAACAPHVNKGTPCWAACCCPFLRRAAEEEAQLKLCRMIHRTPFVKGPATGGSRLFLVPIRDEDTWDNARWDATRSANFGEGKYIVYVASTTHPGAIFENFGGGGGDSDSADVGLPPVRAGSELLLCDLSGDPKSVVGSVTSHLRAVYWEDRHVTRYTTLQQRESIVVMLPTNEPVTKNTRSSDTSLDILSIALDAAVDPVDKEPLVLAVGGYKVGRGDKGSLPCFSQTFAFQNRNDALKQCPPLGNWSSPKASPTFANGASTAAALASASLRRRDDLARGYRRVVGNKTDPYGRLGVCDVVEPPLLVGGSGLRGDAGHLAQVCTNAASAALALLAGNGHLASPAARDWLVASGSELGRPDRHPQACASADKHGCGCDWATTTACEPHVNKGTPCWAACCCPVHEAAAAKGKKRAASFGVNMHAMSWDDTYDADRHVPWEMAAWQLWDPTTACFKGKHVVARMDSLMTAFRTLEQLEREGTLLWRTHLRDGSLLTPLKLGTIPAWEYDIDITIDAQPGKCGAVMEAMQARIELGGKMTVVIVSDSLKTHFGGRGEGGKPMKFKPAPSNANSGYTGSSSWSLFVKPTGFGSVFTPHWKLSCEDIFKNDMKGSYMMTKEAWEKCNAIMRRQSVKGKEKGYSASQGYMVEIKCAEGATPYTATSRERHVRVAIASWNAAEPVVFLGSTTRNSGMMYNDGTLHRYGDDALVQSWNCLGEFEGAA